MSDNLCLDVEGCLNKTIPPCTEENRIMFSNCPFTLGRPIANTLTSPPIEYKGSNRFMNWHGNRFEIGLGFSPFFLREIEKRKNNIEACIIGIFGGAGRGKSYIAIRLAQIIDKDFNPEIQVAFGSSEFLKLISPDSSLKMGQVIIVDEAQFSAGSRNWYNEVQKDLMAHLEAVRSMGFIIFIVALNIATLDVIARNYTLTHMIYMKRRGRGIVYRFYSSPFAKEPYKNRLGIINAKLPDCGKCEHSSCLRCPYSGITKKNPNNLCNNLRARYERKKREYLATIAKESEEKRQAKEQATIEEIKNVIKEEYHTIPRVSNGHLRTEDIALRVKQHTGKIPTRPKLMQARTEWEYENPTIGVILPTQKKS